MGTHPHTLTRALVSTTALAGLLVGSLAGATVSTAAPAPSTPAAAEAEFAPLAVVNLGLSTAQARYVQCYLKQNWSYTGAFDGQLGTNSWKAMQRRLASGYGYTDTIDGIVGPNTVKALQRRLAAGYGYNGAIDGIAGSGTQAAFRTYANSLTHWC
ncbi:peptidoglycan-binding domain-containing protein [Streptomyces sp. NPDC049906]|uniref:peptidoglycan-binding domain-containing protein n=1 Tax=Streptomyces sp. NPDC049906 TaxID=3155656 RepID=UPI00341B8D91